MIVPFVVALPVGYGGCGYDANLVELPAPSVTLGVECAPEPVVVLPSEELKIEEDQL